MTKRWLRRWTDEKRKACEEVRRANKERKRELYIVQQLVKNSQSYIPPTSSPPLFKDSNTD